MAEYTVTAGGRAHHVRVTGAGPTCEVMLEGASVPVRMDPAVGRTVIRVTVGTATYLAVVRREGPEILVTLDDEQHRLRVELAVPIRRRGHGRGAAAADVRAPIPGLIVSVEAAEGTVVEQGRALVVMEAMKMQSELRAPVRGRVTAVRVRPGQEVMGGAVLVTIAPETANGDGADVDGTEPGGE